MGALVQIVLLLLEQELQLFHEEAGNKFVLSLLKLVESVEAHLTSHVSNYLRVDAAHVHLHLRDLLNIFYEELETFFHEAINFQEIS